MSNFVDNGLACKICGLGLHAWNEEDGTKVFVHGRSWEDHGHDPVPIPSHQAANRIQICDFCGDTGADWHYFGRPLNMMGDIGNGKWQYAGQDMDGVWAACKLCDPYVRRNDVDGLWKHYEQSRTPKFMTAVDKALPGMTAEDKAEVGETQRNLWRTFFATITHRERIPPIKPLPPIRPQGMPKVRDRLADLWKSSMGGMVAAGMQEDLQRRGSLPLPGADCGDETVFVKEVEVLTDDILSSFLARIVNGLYVGQLLWVSAEFTHMAVNAAKKLPDASFIREDLPASSGLVVWESAIGEATLKGSPLTMPIHAASWTLVPHGVWITVYGPPEMTLPKADPEVVRKQIGWLIPWSAGGGAPFGADLPVELSAMRTLISTWLLLKQPGMAEVTEEKAHADIRRAYRKADRGEPKVRVVNVRRSARQARPVGDEQATRNYTKGWMVGWSTGGFWRDYWTGTGRSLRERRFIKPYVARGDLPMTGEQTPVPTVRVLR